MSEEVVHLFHVYVIDLFITPECQLDEVYAESDALICCIFARKFFVIMNYTSVSLLRSLLRSQHKTLVIRLQ